MWNLLSLFKTATLCSEIPEPFQCTTAQAETKDSEYTGRATTLYHTLARSLFLSRIHHTHPWALIHAPTPFPPVYEESR